jgi:glutathione S-transferase
MRLQAFYGELPVPLCQGQHSLAIRGLSETAKGSFPIILHAASTPAPAALAIAAGWRATYCRVADGSSASSSNLSLESWLEWEEHRLRPAVYGGDAAALKAAVQQLAEGLAGRKHLVGGQLSLADLVVYATLRPLAGTEVRIRRCSAGPARAGQGRAASCTEML